MLFPDPCGICSSYSTEWSVEDCFCGVLQQTDGDVARRRPDVLPVSLSAGRPREDRLVLIYKGSQSRIDVK